MSALEVWELLSYVVTVIGLPLAIAVFLYEQRKERAGDSDDDSDASSDYYQDFLKIVLENPDLKLFSRQQATGLSEEQRERKRIIFTMLVSLFERAYLLLYEDDMAAKQQRRWSSWQDYLQEWCLRPDFREALPELLRGEDPEFVSYLNRLLATTLQ